MAYAWRVIDKGYTKLKTELMKLEGRSTVYVGVQGSAAAEEHEEGVDLEHVEETHKYHPDHKFLRWEATSTKLSKHGDVLAATATKIRGVYEKKTKTRGQLFGGKRKVTNAQVATWMEYGTPSIPPRPAFRMTIEQNAVKYYEFIKRGLIAIVDRRLKDSHTLMSFLGERAVADVRLTIRKGVPPPLSADRIRRKHSSKPLIDTGQLINSITYEVDSKP